MSGRRLDRVGHTKSTAQKKKSTASLLRVRLCESWPRPIVLMVNAPLPHHAEQFLIVLLAQMLIRFALADQDLLARSALVQEARDIEARASAG